MDIMERSSGPSPLVIRRPNCPISYISRKTYFSSDLPKHILSLLMPSSYCCGARVLSIFCFDETELYVLTLEICAALTTPRRFFEGSIGRLSPSGIDLNRTGTPL